MMWRREEGIVVLAEGEEISLINGYQIIWMNREVTEDLIVERLQKKLGQPKAIHHR
jgi:hypothetical protein